ncbi:hypothetical protein BKA70DRAFT_1264281 [Coprinopsis sp. MPI-PUGE-AT-0042]|nr:hypothetical protein BKA70DRAFT_1264281 [Coprinopsis sp. MPI-PUGE-AT-0042]
MPSPTIASLLELASMMLILLFFVIIPTPSAASPLREGGLALYTREAVLYKKLALGKSLLTGLTNISAIVIAFFAVLYLIHKMLLRPSQQRLMARVIVPPPPLRGRPAAGTIIMSEEAYQRYMHNALPLRLSPSRPAGNPLHRQPAFPWPAR